MADKVKKVLGGKKSKGGKKSGGKHSVHRMHVRHAKNGGYIVEHEYKPRQDGSRPDSDEFQMGDADQFKQHFDEHMAQPPEEEAAAQQQVPPEEKPPAAAPSPGAGMGM